MLNSVIDIPVDTVKLDRAFIRNCTADGRGIFLLKRVVGMIKGLGYHVVCEGVETREQSDILKEAGCEQGQGFLFAKPLPIEEYEQFVYHGNSCGAVLRKALRQNPGDCAENGKT